MKPQQVLYSFLFPVIALCLQAAPGHAQTVQSIFVTPIPNQPFTATVSTERSSITASGPATVFRSTSTIAREATGRIYSEFRPLAPASASQVVPVQSILIYDPVTRISSRLFPQQHTYTVTALSRPPATDTREPFASSTEGGYPQSEFVNQQDLGTRMIAGVAVHGVRQTQTIPADASGSGKEVVLTNEYWYSDELRINLSITHTDPRLGSSSTTVTSLTRSSPAPELFGIPQDYVSVASHAAQR